MSNFESKCMFCGSTGYGSGCIFSPHRLHVHTDDPTRCIYCGMMAYGSGCIFNPYTRMHIHGADVGQTIKETTRKTVELTYITDRLLEPIIEGEAYRLQLIDENGKLLRSANTPYEQNLISPLNRTLHRLKRFMPVEAATLTESLKIMSQTSQKKETIEQYTTKIEFQSEVKYIINELHNLIRTHSKLISSESIEEALEVALLEVIC